MKGNILFSLRIIIIYQGNFLFKDIAESTLSPPAHTRPCKKTSIPCSSCPTCYVAAAHKHHEWLLRPTNSLHIQHMVSLESHCKTRTQPSSRLCFYGLFPSRCSSILSELYYNNLRLKSHLVQVSAPAFPEEKKHSLRTLTVAALQQKLACQQARMK